jgi:hypothetical protein
MRSLVSEASWNNAKSLSRGSEAQKCDVKSEQKVDV